MTMLLCRAALLCAMLGCAAPLLTLSLAVGAKAQNADGTTPPASGSAPSGAAPSGGAPLSPIRPMRTLKAKPAKLTDKPLIPKLTPAEQRAKAKLDHDLKICIGC